MWTELPRSLTFPDTEVMKLKEYIEDQKAPFSRRVYRRGYGAFEPLDMPWAELRSKTIELPGVKVAKLSSVRMVLRVDHEKEDGAEQRIYVKRSLVPTLRKRLGEVFRSSKEWREFNLAIQFRRHGIHVPIPVYYSELNNNGTPVRFFATKALEPRWRASKKHFRDPGSFDEKWRVVASFTRMLHSSDILHGDFRSDHIYLDVDHLSVDDPLSCCALIDLDGSRIGKKVTRKERVRSLRQLAQSLISCGITPDEIRKFLTIYDPDNLFAITAEEVYDIARDRHQERMAIRAMEGD